MWPTFNFYFLVYFSIKFVTIYIIIIIPISYYYYKIIKLHNIILSLNLKYDNRSLRLVSSTIVYYNK